MSKGRPKNDEAFNQRVGADVAIYWAKKGFKVAFTVEPVGETGTSGFFQVRTDMVNGLPVDLLKHDGRIGSRFRVGVRR